MNDGRYLVRPFSETDCEDESRIWSRLNPEEPTTAEEVRSWLHVLEAPGMFKHFLTIEERSSGRVVGTGSVAHSPWSADREWYWIGVQVDPDHQHRGLGRDLYTVLEGVAASRRALGLWAAVRADHPRGLRFFERAGFVERRRVWISRLDLVAVQPTSPARSPEEWVAGGVEFTTVAEEGAERPEFLERLYRLYSEAGMDVPRMGAPAPASFDQFVDLMFRGPGYLPEGMFLARVGNEYASLTFLAKLPSEPDTLHIDFTGTARAFRGRGIASELKRRSIEFARARGYRYVRTGNDSQNDAIWSINEKLGFRRERVFVQGEKRLGG